MQRKILMGFSDFQAARRFKEDEVTRRVMDGQPLPIIQIRRRRAPQSFTVVERK